MEKLGKAASTKREANRMANRMGQYITNELRRVVRIRQWKGGEEKKEREAVTKRLLEMKDKEEDSNINFGATI
jgi:hypothetical protein